VFYNLQKTTNFFTAINVLITFKQVQANNIYYVHHTQSHKINNALKIFAVKLIQILASKACPPVRMISIIVYFMSFTSIEFYSITKDLNVMISADFVDILFKLLVKEVFLNHHPLSTLLNQ